MTLTQVNRILVKAGFEAIGEEEGDTLKGLAALLATLEIESSSITSDSIAFKVAPAINAAGRLGKSDQPLKLLIADNQRRAKKWAADLVQYNNRRKKITEECFDKALKVSRKELINGVSCLIILDDFHEGVLGIVASRLVEHCRLPVLVCCYQPDNRNLIKGSGRAPVGWDLYRLIAGGDEYLNNFGGHELAAGFSLSAGNYLSFKQIVETLAASKIVDIYNDNKKINDKLIDLNISEALNRTLLDNLARLEPTGEGNPKPVFVDRNVRFVSGSSFGKNRAHFKGVVRGKYDNIPVVGFNLNSGVNAVDLHQPCRIVFHHGLETYNGRTSWRIIIRDITQ